MTDKIINDILKDYSPSSRPAGKVSDRGVSMGINIVPLHVNVDTETSTLNSHVWFVMKWTDTRLKWVPTNYENVSTIHLAPEKIWRPDIMVYNSVEHFDYEKTELLVLNDGQVWWVPPVNLHTSCDLDWTYWPWDRQTCHLVVGSWTKTGWELDIQNLNGQNRTKVDSANFAKGAWDLVGGVQERRLNDDYGGTADYFVDIDVTLIMDRRSLLDKKVAVLPLLCAASLLLATFWTHPAASCRLRLNTACVTILVVTLLSLRFMLPSAGGALPLVIAFNTGLVVLAVLQLILALSLSNLVRRSDNPPIRIISILQTIAPFLCLSDMPLIGHVPSHVIPPWAEGGDTERLESGVGTGRGKELTGWNLLAQAVDRVVFLIYLFIILIFLATYVGKATSNLTQA
eukprot:TRINITY_DN21854_c0_g1_i1.p1 TRINITY_DN21854_c0_g1~~TRINITY_DN21854_c0_g1_i1.p1  ORF type:complete len:446 (-),score=84.38 TRINITY_DN21854_c0_g1_i1:281-1480(-)